MTDATATERTERCELCRSWQADNADTITGTCHRHAPRPSGEAQAAHWPQTDADEWCSEFQQETYPPQ